MLPKWASEEPKPVVANSPTPAPTTTTQPAAATPTGPPSTTQKTCVAMFFLIINLGLCVLMAYTGAMGIAAVKNVDDTANIFVGLYMLLFAAILFTFEVIQIRPCTRIDDAYKRNFGFLYGTITKSLYMFFIAILSFGLTDPADFATGTGAAFIVWSVIQFAAAWYFPGYFEKKEKYIPH